MQINFKPHGGEKMQHKKLIAGLLLIVIVSLLATSVIANGYGVSKKPKFHLFMDKLCAYANKDKVHVACVGHWHFLSFSNDKLNCEWKCNVVSFP